MGYDKPQGLQGKPSNEVTEHWFLNDKMQNLERRIVILEQKSEELLKDSQELQATVERILGEGSEK